MGIRDPPDFTIVNTSSRKLLKFPAVTANIEQRPPEVRANPVVLDVDGLVGQSRSSSRPTTPRTRSRPSSSSCYYAGDGHNHFHMRDFDAYKIFNPSA